MSSFRSKTMIFLGILAVAGTGAGLAAPAGGGDDGTHRREGSFRVVVEDGDGNRHEDLFEFDGDLPGGYLGVRIEHAPDGGARIGQVLDDTPAARAGLLAGDVVVGIDGEAVRHAWQLTMQIARTAPGERVALEVLRNGQTLEIEAELAEGNHGPHTLFGNLGEGFDFDFDHEALGKHLEHLGEQMGNLHFDFQLPQRTHGLWSFRSERPRLGVQLTDTTPELREFLGASRDAGVLVGKVLPGTPAEGAGLRAGDLITGLDGQAIANPGELIHALAAGEGGTIVLEIVRDRRTIFVDVALPELEELEEPELPRGPRA